MNKLTYILLFLLLFYSCHTEQTIPVEIDVALHIRDDNHTSPLSVVIENRTKSASSFLWTFEGGEPATFEGKNPPAVTYGNEGTYTIRLTVDNGSATFTSEQEVTVGNPLLLCKDMLKVVKIL